MTEQETGRSPDQPEVPEGAAPDKLLSPAARRALAEAAERRRAGSGEPTPENPPEVRGPPGPEPTRYGDWAVKGRVTDF